ncbi:MAG TPA: protein kinase [Kofleriaceae bacterium]|nr:protein kinase [Kofleriaceae bacterium]
MTVEAVTGRTPKPRIGEVGLVVDQRYRLDALIGAGGFGEVWRATQQVEGQAVRPVALKILSAPSDALATTGSGGDPQSGWLNEVRAIREVSCEAITTIYDVGIAREPRVAFIAMELLEGAPLDRRLAQGPVYWRRALAIARDVATALETCHAVGVTHCDLKPPNIFVTDAGRVCVLDFGIAALGADHSASLAAPADFGGDGFATGAVSLDEMPDSIAPDVSFRLVGTPGYIAPECYGGEPPGPAADVFALGVLLYELIAGRLPYELADDVPTPRTATTRDDYSRYQAALSSATTRGALIPLAQCAPDVPAAVATLVMELMSLDPAARPVDGLRAAIDEAWERPYGLPEPPYVGLEAFDQQRTGFIAGREADIRDITDKLRAGRAVVLSGPSGCGKSSLAAAGVAARIDQELIDGRDGWRLEVIRPASADLTQVGPAPRAAGPVVGTVVVVDQLEEVLTLEDDERTAFCAALADLALGSGSVSLRGRTFAAADPVRVVATVRDDLFGRVAALPELRRFPEQNLYTVRGVEPNAIPHIVEDPAAAAGYRMEGADRVAAEATRVLADDASALPLVQFALTRWWEQRDTEAKLLPTSEWNKIGGIEGALADAAQAVYDALSTSQREHMRTLLIELFRADGTRARVAERQVAGDAEVRAVLERLIERRLVRRQDSGDAGDATLEVVHEALARRWPPLRLWLEETRVERELLQDVQYDADRWQRADRPTDMLWRGSRLDAALRVRERLAGSTAFIDESLHAAGAQRRRRRMLIGTAFAVLLAFVIVLVLAYLDSNAARRQAENQRNAANTARMAADEARVAADDARVAADRARVEADDQRVKAVAALSARDEMKREKDEVEAARVEAETERRRADDERKRAMQLTEELRKQASALQTERDRARAAEAKATASAEEAQRNAAQIRVAEAKARKALQELQQKERELQRLRERDGVGDLPFP